MSAPNSPNSPQEALKVETKTKDNFFGYFKGATIQIDRDKDYDNDFYILVWAKSGELDYDGWWDDSADATIDQAIEEAITGAML